MNNKNTLYFPFILITISLLMAGCGGKPAQPTSAPIPATVAATDIPIPILLPTATDIPIPILLPTPTDIPVPTFSATATSPSTLAVVNVESLGILSGPGTAYGIQAYVLRGDELTILGQTNNCAWLKVSTTDGETGWVAETYVTYSLLAAKLPKLPSQRCPPRLRKPKRPSPDRDRGQDQPPVLPMIRSISRTHPAKAFMLLLADRPLIPCSWLQIPILLFLSAPDLIPGRRMAAGGPEPAPAV